MIEQQIRCRSCIDAHSIHALSGGSKFHIPEAKPHYPPNRFIDVEHIKLEINVDLKTRTLDGVCTTEFSVIAPEVKQLQFDAIDLVIEKIIDKNNTSLKFNQTDAKVYVFLEKPLKSTAQFSLQFHYHVQEPRAGLYFISPSQEYPDRPWQLWTQGEDQDNRYWIPCHDSPNEKATSEMIVHVDEKFTAISNGKLVHSAVDSVKQKRTFHWKQSIPHSSYLITLCIGEFVEIKDTWINSKKEAIPVSYYTFPGREEETKFCFQKTPKMLEIFSKKIGVDYPFEKYAQIVAWDFIFGGMENTSATTQTESTLHPPELDEDYSSEYLVAHELAHQWFGDFLTCKDWSHAWLNEGFATYFESLWKEFGQNHTEFLYELYSYENLYKKEASQSYLRPIVTHTFISPSDLFDRHLYEKGGRVLHMLHNLIGDDLWWKSINSYVKKFSQQTVETIDFQRVVEETTGQSLSWFFEQWIYKAGHPSIKATYEWNEENQQIKLSIIQNQKNSELIPIFKLPLKFKVSTSNNESVHTLDVTQKEHTFYFHSLEKPKFVSLNPENTILGDWDFNPGRELLITQLHNDTDCMGKIFAAKMLSKDLSRKSIDALGNALQEEPFWGVQVELAHALGKIPSQHAQDYLLLGLKKLKHPKARQAVVQELGNFKTTESFNALKKTLKSDPSPLVLFSTGVSLGKFKTQNALKVLIENFGKRNSWHDYYDRGILKGLSAFRFHESQDIMPLLIESLKLGHSPYLRREAILALAEHTQINPKIGLSILLECLNDYDYFVKAYTISCLADLGDEAAIPAIHSFLEKIVDPRLKRAAYNAARSLKTGESTKSSIDKIQSELDSFRQQNQELMRRIENLESITSSNRRNDSSVSIT